jgi:hypothetical protein
MGADRIVNVSSETVAGMAFAERPFLPGHEAMYIVSPDNGAGRPLAELISHHFGEAVEVRDLPRDDAGGISAAKAERLLGYRPKRSWRDYLSPEGELLDAVRDRLRHGETGVQRGRAALS